MPLPQIKTPHLYNNSLHSIFVGFREYMSKFFHNQPDYELHGHKKIAAKSLHPVIFP